MSKKKILGLVQYSQDLPNGDKEMTFSVDLFENLAEIFKIQPGCYLAFVQVGDRVELEVVNDQGAIIRQHG